MPEINSGEFRLVKDLSDRFLNGLKMEKPLFVNDKRVQRKEDDKIKLLEPRIGYGERADRPAKKPLVSVLMAVYNSFSCASSNLDTYLPHARSNLDTFLPQALDSLLAQTYQDFELLILDNQSTDKTPEVCKSYAAKDKRIRYILDNKKRSPEAGVEHLASFMQGQYCMTACDDDMWHPEYIEKTVRFLEQNPDIDLAYSNGSYIDINGKLTGDILVRQDYYTSATSPFANFMTYIQKRNVIPIAFGLYKADVYRRLLPFKAFDKLKVNVDNLFMARFFLLGFKCHCLDEYLFCYRNKPRDLVESMTTKLEMPGLDKPLLIWLYYVRHQFCFYQEIMKEVGLTDLTAIQKLLAQCATSRGFVIHSLNLLQWIKNDVAKNPSDKFLCEKIRVFFIMNLSKVLSEDESKWEFSDLINEKLLELLKQRIGAIAELVKYYNDLINTSTKPELVSHVESLLQQEIQTIERAKSQLLSQSSFQKSKITNINDSPLEELRASGLWKEGQPLRLHLGCGEQRLEGYVNIDYPPSEHTVQTKTGADIFADITTLNFPTHSVDEIRLHHVFEHFDRATALALLIKWHSCLKIGEASYRNS